MQGEQTWQFLLLKKKIHQLCVIAFFTALSTGKSLWQINSAQIKLKMQYTTKTGNSYLSKENKQIKQEGTVVL